MIELFSWKVVDEYGSDFVNYVILLYFLQLLLFGSFHFVSTTHGDEAGDCTSTSQLSSGELLLILLVRKIVLNLIALFGGSPLVTNYQGIVVRWDDSYYHRRGHRL